LMESLRPVADRVVLSFVRTEISSHLMAGAASTTTRNIVAYEINQDDNQFCKKRPIASAGKLAIPAATRHLNPDWMNPKTKWL